MNRLQRHVCILIDRPCRCNWFDNTLIDDKFTNAKPITLWSFNCAFKCLFSIAQSSKVDCNIKCLCKLTFYRQKLLNQSFFIQLTVCVRVPLFCFDSSFFMHTHTFVSLNRVTQARGLGRTTGCARCGEATTRTYHNPIHLVDCTTCNPLRIFCPSLHNIQQRMNSLNSFAFRSIPFSFGNRAEPPQSGSFLVWQILGHLFRPFCQHCRMLNSKHFYICRVVVACCWQTPESSFAFE